jgi:hypothetical protein
MHFPSSVAGRYAGRCALLVVALFGVAACTDADATRRAEALANADTPLQEGAVRQPIPAGIDPTMITWRSDGTLIPSQDSLAKTPGYVIDSIFPPEEMLRRFQSESGVPVTALSGGERSLEALLERYWSLLVAGDTLAMTPLVASQREFAYLYFPESRELTDGVPPAISWLMLSSNGGRGLTRALREAAAGEPASSGTVCRPLELPAGQSRIIGPCGVLRTKGGQRDTLWFVKHVIERDGVFKLMSFSNDL